MGGPRLGLLLLARCRRPARHGQVDPRGRLRSGLRPSREHPRKIGLRKHHRVETHPEMGQKSPTRDRAHSRRPQCHRPKPEGARSSFSTRRACQGRRPRVRRIIFSQRQEKGRFQSRLHREEGQFEDAQGQRVRRLRRHGKVNRSGNQGPSHSLRWRGSITRKPD